MPHAEPKVNRELGLYTHLIWEFSFGTEIFCTPGVSALINNNTEGAADDLNRHRVTGKKMQHNIPITL